MPLYGCGNGGNDMDAECYLMHSDF